MMDGLGLADGRRGDGEFYTRAASANYAVPGSCYVHAYH
jgi:hypothetical protein